MASSSSSSSSSQIRPTSTDADATAAAVTVDTSCAITASFNEDGEDADADAARILRRDARVNAELANGAFFKWMYAQMPSAKLQVEHKLIEANPACKLGDFNLSLLRDPTHYGHSRPYDKKTIVLPLSQIRVRYLHWAEGITVTIVASHPADGFTHEELCDKVHKYYDFFNEAAVPRDRHSMFSRVLTGTHSDGIAGMYFNKEALEWCVERANYC